MKNFLVCTFILLIGIVTWSAFAGIEHKHQQEAASATPALSTKATKGHAHLHSPATEPSQQLNIQTEPHADVAIIPAATAERVGIQVAHAAAGVITRQLPLYGEIVLPPQRQAVVRARFPGIISQLKVSLGQQVKRGEVLALIESNDSLRSYPLQAPITGIVLQQFANEGEFTAGEPLLALSDLSELWAEFKVFPAMRHQVQAGQAITLETLSGAYDSVISQLLPASGQPYLLANVTLDNHSSHFTLGDRLRALVAVETLSAALVVANTALQTFEGQAVVFVQNGDQYQPRALQLGRSDGLVTEVLSGLAAGEAYVVANSYVVKAELEKSAAAHQH